MNRIIGMNSFMGVKLKPLEPKRTTTDEIDHREYQKQYNYNPFRDKCYSQEKIRNHERFHLIQHFVAELEDKNVYSTRRNISGTPFGNVEKVQNDKVYALKKMRQVSTSDDIPKSVLHEIYMLRKLRHANVIKLFSCCVSKCEKNYRTFYLRMKLGKCDLDQLMFTIEVQFYTDEIKILALSLLEGLAFIHSKGIMHRNISPSNIVVTNQGVLKIINFERACDYNENGPNKKKPKRFNKGYNAPELYLKDINYGPGIDMWGAGIIVMEMFVRQRLIMGEGSLEQLNNMARLFGKINIRVYPKCNELPEYESYEEHVYYTKYPLFCSFLTLWVPKKIYKLIKSLLGGMMKLYPPDRLSASDTLKCPWFEMSPPPEKNVLSLMGRIPVSMSATVKSS
ncbi:hypothetical protein GCK72_025115 [Caenorhabditis remanei]|uniref:Protein kinase domain-containing protein n=1 Tax=Caenorhabditis remanei TaxID=31234 RepID=A0A6A5G135_CAERE|nr:hypothetical protein GCK72_025115 [Caenorhabditis remanei]KAF1748648.1 hypothetical protein GCK72_025115 [Caenorhabditis remanei]